MLTPLSVSRTRMIRRALVLGLPVAAAVVLVIVPHESDRALVDSVFGVAWVLALLSALRNRWAVVTVSCAIGLAILPWAIVAWAAASPCEFGSAGPLVARPGCPLHAAHIVAAVAGAGCTAALIAVFAAGCSYSSGGNEQRLRLFGHALLAAAVLLLLWLPSVVILPRGRIE